MPPAFVQSKGGTSNTLNSLGIAFTSNNTAGNLLVCSGVVNVSALAGLTITDTQGNTWTIALVDNWKALNTFFMAYAPNCKAGANTVTIAQLGSLISGAISEYSGVSGAAPLDASGFNDSGSGTWTAATSGNVTTRENGELIVAAQGNSTGPASITLGSGFSNLQNDSGNFVSIESQVQATAGAIAGTFTISASSGACGVLTFVPPTDALPFNVWTPQGNIFTGTALGNQTVIQDNNSKILFPGTPATIVYKMWYGKFSTGELNYAESADGLTGWTNSVSNPILTGVINPVVWKVGSTYYLFGGPGTGQLTLINEWTSSDGITWANQGTAVSAGGAGTWDSQQVAQLNLLDVIGGTFYAYYSGVKVGGQLQGGLVTSPNGLPPWTKDAGNPHIAGLNGRAAGGWFFIKVGSVYYGWGQCEYKDTQIAANAFTSLMRWSSPSPTGPWTQLAIAGSQVATYYATTPNEFSQQNAGAALQLGDPSFVVDVAGNRILLYFDIGVGGAEGQINQAVATGITPAQLVAGYEGVVGAPISGAPQLNLVTLGSDPGTGANANPIGGNWTKLSNTATYSSAQRLSDQIAGDTAANNHDSWWNAIAFPNNQWAQIIPAITSASGFIGASPRSNTANAATSYKIQWGGVALGSSTSLSIVRSLAGTVVTLKSITGLTVSLTDTLMQAVNGSNIYSYYNGILIHADVDANIASGSAGFELFNAQVAANAAIGAWSGGTFQDAPALQASISGNAGVGGATVAYSGTSSGSVTADSFGNYLLSNLPDGPYTVTPSLSGYTFSPTSASETLNGTNITGVNFTATKVSSKGSGGEQRFGFGFNFKF